MLWTAFIWLKMAILAGSSGDHSKPPTSLEVEKNLYILSDC